MNNKVEEKAKAIICQNPSASGAVAKAMNDHLNPIKAMIEIGIPVWRAEFHAAVNNSDGVPEHYFSADSASASRHVKMWWVRGDGLLCLHKDRYFIVPSASVKFAKFEDINT